jgi:hypothetical protein
MSLLYKKPEDINYKVEISKISEETVKFTFSSDCGKFGADEQIAEFEITPKELLSVFHFYEASKETITFKKVSEIIVEHYSSLSESDISELKRLNNNT